MLQMKVTCVLVSPKEVTGLLIYDQFLGHKKKLKIQHIRKINFINIVTLQKLMVKKIRLHEGGKDN